MSAFRSETREVPDTGTLGVGFAIKHLLRVGRRHPRLFLLCFCSVLVSGVMVLETLTPTYTATAIVAISHRMADPLAPTYEQPADQFTDDALPRTIASMMQSRDVAAAVLADVPPPAVKRGRGFAGVLCQMKLSSFCRQRFIDPSTEQQRNIDELLGTLTVMPQMDSRVIDVSVTATAGPHAARLADAVVRNYQRIALARQTAESDRVATWLQTRTAELRQRWLKAVDTANTYSISHNLQNAGDGPGAAPLIDNQISDLAASLTAAQSQLAMAQSRSDALRDAARHGDASALLVLPEQPILVAAANSLMQLENTRDQLAQEFGLNYPKVRALNKQIMAARVTLNRQTTGALASIHETNVLAKAQVQQLTAALDQLRAQAQAQSAAEAVYLSLNAEATSAHSDYETFLEHADDVVDRTALLEPPVSIVSNADVPLQPSFPNKPPMILGLFVAALVVATAATLISDHFSEGFEEADDLRSMVQLPLLATIPFLTAKPNRAIWNYILDEPYSRTSEAVRGVAATLSLLADERKGARSVLVTSAGAHEGKTTLALWLAMTVRQGGHAVLLIGGDTRRGSLLRKSSTTPRLGLTDLLSGKAQVTDVVQQDPTTRIDFISGGSPKALAFGTEEIARLRNVIASLQHSYSLIVIDSPPLLAMVDGLVLASVVDQTLFLCRWRRTSRSAIGASLDRLRTYGARVSGVVVTMVDQNSEPTFAGGSSRREAALIKRLYGS